MIESVPDQVRVDTREFQHQILNTLFITLRFRSGEFGA